MIRTNNVSSLVVVLLVLVCSAPVLAQGAPSANIDATSTGGQVGVQITNPGHSSITVTVVIGKGPDTVTYSVDVPGESTKKVMLDPPSGTQVGDVVQVAVDGPTGPIATGNVVMVD